MDRWQPGPTSRRYFELNGLSGISGEGAASALHEREPFRFRHEFSENSWFSRDRILDLAHALPKTSVEYNLADLPVSQPVTTIPRSGLSLEETVRNIEDCGSWVLLKSVERHAGYAELLGHCLEEIGGELGLRVDEMLSPRSFLFLASPGGVTPFHFDPEHNFLLQIEGPQENPDLRSFRSLHCDRSAVTGFRGRSTSKPPLRGDVCRARRVVRFQRRGGRLHTVPGAALGQEQRIRLRLLQHQLRDGKDQTNAVIVSARPDRSS